MAERRTIEPEEARELLASGEAGAVDLRDPEEVAKGHAPAAVPVLDGDLEGAVEQAMRGRDDVPLLVFGDDEEAIDRLEQSGHETIIVEGGWKRWQDEGHPVLPRSDEEYEGPELVMPGVSGGSGPPEGEDEEEEAEAEGEDEEEEEEAEADADSGGPEGEGRARHEEPVDSEAREQPAGDQPAQEPREETR